MNVRSISSAACWRCCRNCWRCRCIPSTPIVDCRPATGHATHNDLELVSWHRCHSRGRQRYHPLRSSRIPQVWRRRQSLSRPRHVSRRQPVGHGDRIASPASAVGDGRTRSSVPTWRRCRRDLYAAADALAAQGATTQALIGSAFVAPYVAWRCHEVTTALDSQSPSVLNEKARCVTSSLYELTPPAGSQHEQPARHSRLPARCFHRGRHRSRASYRR